MQLPKLKKLFVSETCFRFCAIDSWISFLALTIASKKIIQNCQWNLRFGAVSETRGLASIATPIRYIFSLPTSEVKWTIPLPIYIPIPVVLGRKRKVEIWAYDRRAQSNNLALDKLWRYVQLLWSMTIASRWRHKTPFYRNSVFKKLLWHHTYSTFLPRWCLKIKSQLLHIYWSHTWFKNAYRQDYYRLKDYFV